MTGADEDGGPSPEVRQWVAERDRARAAAAEDRLRARQEQAEEERRLQRDYQNPAALGCGVIVLVLLVVAGLFVFDATRCNPFFSDSGMMRSKDCR